MTPGEPSTTLRRTLPSLGRRGVVMLLAAAVLWSINGAIIKSLFASGMGGCGIAAYRSCVAALFLLPLAMRRRGRIEEPKWVIVCVLLFTAMCATFVLATTLTTAANAIILQYTAPAWVFLLSPWILGDRTEPRYWIALGLSMSAVSLIFFAQYTADSVGLIVSLVSGVVFGVQGIFFRRARRVDPVMLAFLACAGSGVLLLPVAVALEGWTLTASSAGILLFMGVFQFGIPYVLYAGGVRYVSAQKAILILMLEPVLNPLWVFVFRGERPHWSTLVGGVVILGSVVYLSLWRASGNGDRS